MEKCTRPRVAALLNAPHALDSAIPPASQSPGAPTLLLPPTPQFAFAQYLSWSDQPIYVLEKDNDLDITALALQNAADIRKVRAQEGKGWSAREAPCTGGCAALPGAPPCVEKGGRYTAGPAALSSSATVCRAVALLQAPAIAA